MTTICYKIVCSHIPVIQPMSNNNIDKMTQRLQNLSVQRTYAQESLDNINQEANVVEYQLRGVGRSVTRRNMATTLFVS